MSAGRATRRTNAVERTIEALATALGNSIGWLAEHGVLFIGYGLIWLTVGVGLLLNQGTVSETWSTIGSQHIVVQALLWLLFLPVLAGLWVWQTDWPVWLRALLVIGLTGWNLLVFVPRRGTQPATPGGGGAAAAGG